MTDRCHRITRMKGARKSRRVLDMFVLVPFWHDEPQQIEPRLYRNALEARALADRRTRASDVYQYLAMPYRDALLVTRRRLRIRVPVLVPLS